MFGVESAILSVLSGAQSRCHSNPQSAFDLVNAYNAQAAYGMQRDMQIAQLQNLAILGNAAARQKECEGCGAPLKAYIHHCEYCRRSA